MCKGTKDRKWKELNKSYIPWGSTPPSIRFCPWTFNPDPLLAAKFSLEERPGMDNPPELIFLPKLPPPTMFPIEFVIRGPALPNNWDIPIPGTLFRLLSPADVERIPGIEPPTPFELLLNPGLPTTLRPPLFGIPECPWELPWDNYKTIILWY